jgi:hypothetical protein
MALDLEIHRRKQRGGFSAAGALSPGGVSEARAISRRNSTCSVMCVDPARKLVEESKRRLRAGHQAGARARFVALEELQQTEARSRRPRRSSSRPDDG